MAQHVASPDLNRLNLDDIHAKNPAGASSLTPLAADQPFEYIDNVASGDALEIAARGVRLTGNAPGGFRINPNGMDVDYFDDQGNLCAQYHESHGAAHGHNFSGRIRDSNHLPMSPIPCR